MRGSKTPRKTELEFRAKLLELGTVSAAAKAVKIPVNTGYALAQRAEADEDWVKARDAMLGRVVPEVEARLMRLAEKVEKRVEVEDLSPRQLAALATKNGLKSFSYQNPKPQYFRGLVDFYGKLVAARKGNDPSEITVKAGVPITINVRPTPAAEARLAGEGGGPRD